MTLPDYNSPSALKSILDENDFAMRKRFGQNFLVNGAFRTRLVDSLELEAGMSVWEIGPGLGAMTKELLERGAVVTAFEIDKGFIRLLESYFAEFIKNKKLIIVEGDALKTWRQVLKEHGEPKRFFGNLPYNIAASLIADTIEEGSRFEKMTITVQKEIALRMTAKAGSKEWSSFSVLCGWAYDIQPLFDMAGGNFFPRPRITSTALSLVKKADFPACENPKLFVKMQRALFRSRRKNIRNNLTAFLNDTQKAEAALAALGIAPECRGETLSVPTLLRLCDELNRAILMP